MNEDQLSKLSNKTRKVLQGALLPQEHVHAVLNGRESQAIALTDSRIVLVNGSLLFRGDNAMHLADVAMISSGMTGMSIGMKNGSEYVFEFWPSGRNRTDAKAFVQMVRELQARAQHGPTPVQESVADQLAKFDQLRQQGVLSEAEFAAQKAKLLDA